jgi:hypothetical protein
MGDYYFIEGMFKDSLKFLYESNLNQMKASVFHQYLKQAKDKATEQLKFSCHDEIFSDELFEKYRLPLQHPMLLPLLLNPPEGNSETLVNNKGMTFRHVSTLNPGKWVNDMILSDFIKSYFDDIPPEVVIVTTQQAECAYLNDQGQRKNFLKSLRKKFGKARRFSGIVNQMDYHWITVEFDIPQEPQDTFELTIYDSACETSSQPYDLGNGFTRITVGWFWLLSQLLIKEELHPKEQLPFPHEELKKDDKRGEIWQQFFFKSFTARTAADNGKSQQPNGYDCGCYSVMRVFKHALNDDGPAYYTSEPIMPMDEFRVFMLRRIVAHYGLQENTKQLLNNCLLSISEDFLQWQEVYNVDDDEVVAELDPLVDEQYYKNS